MTTLLMVFAIQRVPGDERIVVERPKIADRIVDPDWAASFEDAVLRKTDREPVKVVKTIVVESEPTPVRADVPAKARYHIMEEEPKRKRHRESNACTRHGKRKVETHGGKSWRCR